MALTEQQVIELAKQPPLSNQQVGQIAQTSTIDATRLGSSPALNVAPQYTPTAPNIANLPTPVAPPLPVTTPTPDTASILNTRLQELQGKTLGKEADTEASVAAAQSPYQSQLDELSGQIRTNQADALARVAKNTAQEEAILQRPGGTTEYAGGSAQVARRTFALEEMAHSAETLKLAALADVAQGKIDSAQKKATLAINTKYAQIEKELQAAKNNIYNNWDSFTAKEKKRAEATLLSIDAKDAVVALKKDDDKIVMGWQAEALKNGASNFQIQQAEGKTPAEALTILGQFFKDPQAKEKALAELEQTRAQTALVKANTSKAYADIAKTKKETDALGLPVITNPVAAKYSQALSVILGSASFTKEQKASVVAAINNGEDAFTVIKNQTKNIMGQTEATTLTKYEASKSAMIDLQTNLKEFYAKGGDTGIFTGNYEKVINKLGSVKDPGLVDLATQIQTNLQVYRNAVSGTAYSEQEGKDIAAIFPGINKTEGLNMSILSGRMKAFDSTIDGIYKSTLGGAYTKLRIEELAAEKGFDLVKAKTAGYTDAEILSFLNK